MVPVIVDLFADSLPFIQHGGTDGMSTTDMSLLLYGLLIVIFLLAEPKGLVAVIRRISARGTSRNLGIEQG